MKKLKFSLQDGERILSKTRFSSFVLITKFFTTIFSFGFPVLIISLPLVLMYFENKIIASVFTVILILIFSFFYQYLLWKSPVLFVTNRRIIFCHQKSFYAGKIVEIKLENISEVVATRKSFWNSLFGFGTIRIAPVSGTEKFKVPYLPRSEQIAEKITSIYDKDSDLSKEDRELSEKNLPEKIIKSLSGVIELYELDYKIKDKIAEMEKWENRGTYEVLRRKNVWCVLIEEDFAYQQVSKEENGRIILPAINFIAIKDAIAAFPSSNSCQELALNFPHKKATDRIMLVGR